MQKKSKKVPQKDLMEFMIGVHKAKFIRYIMRKKRFYQAEAAQDLHWSVNATQYYLDSFVRYHLLKKDTGKYKVYYVYNPNTLRRVFK